MLGQEGGDLPGLVRRQVVEDDMQGLPPRLLCDQRGQEGDKRGRGMALDRLAQDVPGAGIEGRIKRVLKAA